MSDERFKLNDKGSFILEDGEPLKPLGNVVHKLNEQQATISTLKEENEQLRQKLQEYKENWDDMVELATKTSLRNIVLDERIGQLKAKLREKEEDERLYADEIVKLNKEAKEVLDFKSLGGDY